MKNAAVLTAASIAETEQKADPHSRPSRCLPDRNCGSKSQFPPTVRHDPSRSPSRRSRASRSFTSEAVPNSTHIHEDMEELFTLIALLPISRHIVTYRLELYQQQAVAIP